MNKKRKTVSEYHDSYETAKGSLITLKQENYSDNRSRLEVHEVIEFDHDNSNVLRNMFTHVRPLSKHLELFPLSQHKNRGTLLLEWLEYAEKDQCLVKIPAISDGTMVLKKNQMKLFVALNNQDDILMWNDAQEKSGFRDHKTVQQGKRAINQKFAGLSKNAPQSEQKIILTKKGKGLYLNPFSTVPFTTGCLNTQETVVIGTRVNMNHLSLKNSSRKHKNN